MDKTFISSVAALGGLILLTFSLGGFTEQSESNIKAGFKFEHFVGNISVEEDPDLPTLGRHQKVGGVHFIKLKKYPICLLHEIRHATEGEWHKGRDSDEDCYQH